MKSMFVLWLYSHFRLKDEKGCLCSGYIPIFVLKDEKGCLCSGYIPIFVLKDEKGCLCFGYIAIFLLKMKKHVCALVIFTFSC